MEWKVDTGTKGECKASELRAVLEDDRDHFLKTQADHAHDQIMMTAPNPKEPGVDARAFGERMQAISAAAKAAKDAHVAKAAGLKEYIDLGIKQACEQAALFGGLVAATVSGHYNPRHASGCSNRLSVQVDQTWHDEG